MPALKLLRNFPDAKSDAETGKNTLVVLIGQSRARYLYIGLVIAAVIMFIPAFVITRTPFALLNIIPAVFSGIEPGTDT